MQQELRFATLNVCNLALPGLRFYEGVEPYTAEQYGMRIAWLAQQLDRLDADVIGLQEIFSAAALPDVLAATRLYRNAWHACAGPTLLDGKPTPGVAVISRLHRMGDATAHQRLPGGPAFALPQRDAGITDFTRPVLHARLRFAPQRMLHLFVLHLKSPRPDFVDAQNAADAPACAMAMLRSLMRRGIDAWGMRRLVADVVAREPAPVVVMGDFNDDADAVTTQMVMTGGMQDAESRLRNCSRLKRSCDPLRDPGYSYRHDGRHECIDHVLVSEEFDPAASNALAETVEVAYLNDHLSVRTPGASDHGAVLVRMRLRQDAQDAQVGLASPM